MAAGLLEEAREEHERTAHKVKLFAEDPGA
jgi:hypothetical protein